MIALGIIAVFVGTFVGGQNYQGKLDAVADLNAQIATLTFDRDEATKKAKEAAADANLIEASSLANSEKVDAAESIIARSYGCPSHDDLVWLLSVGKSGPRKGSEPIAGLRAAGGDSLAEGSAAERGCTPLLIIAARERAGRLKANDIIVHFAKWYRGQIADFAKGKAG